jgi:hypothetical protein
MLRFLHPQVLIQPAKLQRSRFREAILQSQPFNLRRPPMAVTLRRERDP